MFFLFCFLDIAHVCTFNIYISLKISSILQYKPLPKFQTDTIKITMKDTNHEKYKKNTHVLIKVFLTNIIKKIQYNILPNGEE